MNISMHNARLASISDPRQPQHHAPKAEVDGRRKIVERHPAGAPCADIFTFTRQVQIATDMARARPASLR
jgi:hypothetical protein